MRWSAGGSVTGAAASGVGAAKPVDRSTAAYQTGAHTPSLLRRPAGHDSISSRNGISSARAERGEHPARIGQHVGGFDHRRRMSESVGDAIENLALLDVRRCRRASRRSMRACSSRGPARDRGSGRRCARGRSTRGRSRRACGASCASDRTPSRPACRDRRVARAVARRRAPDRSRRPRSPRRASDGRDPSGQARRRRTARPTRRNRAGSRTRASSRSRCCAGPTTWRSGRCRRGCAGHGRVTSRRPAPCTVHRGAA